MRFDYDVIVVGAGFAGLTAAHTLHQAGYRTVCFEARDRVGGRAATVEVAGLAVDLGATWYWHNEPLVVSLVEQLGLATFQQALTGDAMFEPPEQPAQRLNGNPIDTPATRLRDGAQGLAAALAQQLPPDRLHLNDPVSAIRQEAQQLVVAAASATFTAQHVVVALPPALVVDLVEFTPELPAQITAAAEATAVWMGDMIKAVAVYDQPFWRSEQLAGSAISYRGPFREFHDHSGPDDDGLGAIFGFAPAAALPNATNVEIGEAFEAQLARIFGSVARDSPQSVVTNWARERYTTPVRSADAGSGLSNPVFLKPVRNRIHWAATETATAFSGHVEGAIRAGLHAAQNVETYG